MKSAVIYCRVSSKKQVREGHGLSSQETTCRQYAEQQGLEVVRVFRDDYSGGGDFWARPGITALLRFLEEREEEFAVVFDDIKRFARDTLFHLKLRQELATRRAYPLCPTFRFEDTPEGEFVETVIAATAQLERQQNRRQVVRRMRARLEAGFWVFSPPVGYRFARRHGEKVLIRDEPHAGIVREALKKFAAGEFASQAAVSKFLYARGCHSTQGAGGKFSSSAIRRLLLNEVYSGWCISKKWSLRVRGRHEALITEQEHRKIRVRLISTPKAPPRPKRAAANFPLRGVIRCVHCDRSIVAYWAQGRNQRYPYYRCTNSGCINIRQERMEAQLLERLWEAIPRVGYAEMLEHTLVSHLGDRDRLQEDKESREAARIKEIDQETAVLVDALSRASASAVLRVYEEKIASLQAEREQCETKVECVEPDLPVEPVLEKGRKILRNPHDAWADGDLQDRRIVQTLVFEPPILYDREEAYRTAEFSLLFRLMRSSGEGSSSLVDSVKRLLNPAAEELRRWREVLGLG